MTRSIHRLYELLPAVHRARDAEQGYPLRALLSVITEQVNVVEDDIARVYDNWFIETCQDWVVPFIGDLIGYNPVHDPGRPSDEGPASGAARDKILIPRRDVASTLTNRRRKGTIALLEDLAMQVAGWPARAVELYQLLARTQHLDHVVPSRGRTVDLRDAAALDHLGGPFDPAAHLVDVRRIASHRSVGLHNIPSVGVFVWRLKQYSVTLAPAYCLEAEGPQFFMFNVLGHDTPLFTRPEPERDRSQIAQPINLPVPIRRRALEERVADRPLKTQASAAYYGEGKSIAIYAPGWPTKGAPQPIPRERIVPADLSSGQYRARRDHVGLDPATGRIVFPATQLPKAGVWVTYHYGFSADIGGGEYDRPLSQPLSFTLYRVAKIKEAGAGFDSITGALLQWRKDQEALGPEPPGEAERREWNDRRARLRAAVIEIEDSSAYSERLRIELDAGESLQIRAANRKRPVIRMLDFVADQPDALRISGKRASRFTLDGILVTGRGMQIVGPDRGDGERLAEGDLCDVTLRHVTLVPGWGLESDCKPKRPNEPSLELLGSGAKVVVEHSIIGSIVVAADEVQTDPVAIRISDSIVDATSATRSAVGAEGGALAFASLSILRSTVIGTVSAHAVLLAENSIFTSRVLVARRQIGCVRFCYVPAGSRTPRRHHCQPDLARAAVDGADPPIPEGERPAAKEREEARVRPRWSSLRYGVPTYCQLASDCADEIKRGADDESEMGVFHDLFQPQREANLRVRLDEYTPAGMEARILFAD
ncbi:hypothetical protein [Sorangium sp. So ce131]|uniref:hypothetical protein n=1 Tax=Sorangium sp. So ce131 TaxID=3133282 RepID=UPI003F6276FC